MKRKPLVLFGILVALLIAGTLLFVLRSDHGQDAKARAQLDQMLGADPNPEIANPSFPDPLAHAEPEADPFGDMLAENPFGFKFSMPSLDDVGIKVEETPQAYVLSIPMKDRANEKNVDLKVQPHHIDVSAKVTENSDVGSFTSSYMQSFGTQAELLPDQVTRDYKENKLVITVPKKPPGTASKRNPESGESQPKTIEKSLPQEVLDELNQGDHEVI